MTRDYILERSKNRGKITVDTVKQYLRLKPLSGIDWLRDNYKHLYNKIG